ncbi:MAG: hypothetical protein IKU47_03370 [Oscillospiraceae bacterium]|nr:hypothetical protein [Oscillospiraceae bacterium]
MKNSTFRILLSDVFAPYNAFFGDNTGSFDEHDYKINYQIANNILLGGQRTYIIDVDVWCKSTTRVDIIADEIETLLNYQSKKADSWVTFFLEGRYNADEKNIYRRTLTYEVRTYQED